LNIQTERLDDHTARLTVEISTEMLDSAKKKAASKLAQKYRIPGFRPGKAPYQTIARFLGEGAIMEEAIDLLTNEVYPVALTESQLDPYAPGIVEDFKLDPPSFVFSLPLAPTVELGEYRDVRVEFTQEEVTEANVEDTLEKVRNEQAEQSDVEGDIAVGHYVVFDLHSAFVDGEERPETEDDSDEDESEEKRYKNDDFLHFHDYELQVDPEKQPLLAGFSEKLVGAKVGEKVSFELVVPADSTEHSSAAGRTVNFDIYIKSAKQRSLPELNDEFAAKITVDEETPLTMAQLRQRVQENLGLQAEAKARNAHAEKVLDAIVEQAVVAYPKAVLDDRVEEMMKEFTRDMSQYGITPERYYEIIGTDAAAQREKFVDDAKVWVKRSLVFGEVLTAERIGVTPDDLTNEMQAIIESYGATNDRKELFKFLNSAEQRETILNRLLYRKLTERVSAIGKGEAVALDAETTTNDAPETPSEDTEA